MTAPLTVEKLRAASRILADADSDLASDYPRYAYYAGQMWRDDGKGRGWIEVVEQGA